MSMSMGVGGGVGMDGLVEKGHEIEKKVLD
jgi:hypothetical protein